MKSCAEKKKAIKQVVTLILDMSIYIYIYIPDVSVKRFRTAKRVRVHPEDSKSYSNQRSEKPFRSSGSSCAKVPRFRTANRHSAQGLQVSRMVDFIKAELTDMHLAY